MKRTTIFLDPSMESDLRAIAQREGTPVAALVREAVANLVASRQPRAGRRLSFTGIGDSGRTDGAERHEELLWTSPHPEETLGLVAEPEPEPYSGPRQSGTVSAGS